MTQIHRIPRGANAGVAFLGVDLSDTAPMIASLFISLPLSSGGSWLMPIVCVCIGFLLTRGFVNYKKEQLDGFVQCILYKYAIDGYSDSFNRQNKIFIGNSIITNPGFIDTKTSC